MQKFLFVVYMLLALIPFAGSKGSVSGEEVSTVAKEISSKIVVEAKDRGVLKTSAAEKDKIKEVIKNGKCAVSIILKYDSFDINTYNNIKGDTTYDIQDFRSQSKNYHKAKNEFYASKLNVKSDNVFISEYTPFIFYQYENTNADYIYEIANTLAGNDFVNVVYVSSQIDSSIDTSSEENLPLFSPLAILPPLEKDYRTLTYDNFPVGTSYTGDGVKVGILGTGGFSPSHTNFLYNNAYTVYDTYTANNANSDPLRIAFVLGGKYGIASKADIYYVDSNSDNIGFPLIEKLINVGVDVVDIGVIDGRCITNEPFDYKLEGYFDYLYTSTHTIMVADSGTYLNLQDSGGYTCQPGGGANVITVGSVDEFGNPSHFSSFKQKGPIPSSPTISAQGENRMIGGYGTGLYNGNKYSVAAVVGTIALLKEKFPNLNMLSAKSILTATANRNIINTSSEIIELNKLEGDSVVPSGNYITVTNDIKIVNGLFERVGAGQLDIAAALSYSREVIDYPVSIPEDYVQKTLDTIYLDTGWTLVASLTWERSATMFQDYPWTSKYYLSNSLRDLDLMLYKHETSTQLTSTYSSDSNLEMFTFTANAPDYYDLKLMPFSNPDNATHANLSYSYYIRK